MKQQTQDKAPSTNIGEDKFTSGEWNNYLHDGNVYCGGIVVANCYSSFISPASIKANAALISAAPDLLRALQQAIECASEGYESYPKATQLMGIWLKAIKKANQSK